jgi:hypothetical protein
MGPRRLQGRRRPVPGLQSGRRAGRATSTSERIQTRCRPEARQAALAWIGPAHASVSRARRSGAVFAVYKRNTAVIFPCCERRRCRGPCFPKFQAAHISVEGAPRPTQALDCSVRDRAGSFVARIRPSEATLFDALRGTLILPCAGIFRFSAVLSSLIHLGLARTTTLCQSHKLGSVPHRLI